MKNVLSLLIFLLVFSASSWAQSIRSIEKVGLVSSTKIEKKKSKAFIKNELAVNNRVDNRIGDLEKINSSLPEISSLGFGKMESLQTNTWPEEKRKFRFGFMVGPNFSNGKSGMTFGFSLERRLSSQWSIELAASYRNSSIKDWAIDSLDLTTYNVERNYAIGETPVSLSRLEYTDFPLMIKWRSNQRFTFYGGPKLGILRSAYGMVIPFNSANPFNLSPGSNDVVDLSHVEFLRKVEWGAVLGTVFHLHENIGLGLRGHFGLTSFTNADLLVPSPQKRNMDLQFLVQLSI